MKSPIVLLSALLTDVKRLEPDVRNLDRDLKTIEARVKHEGIGFLTVALSTYCDALDEGLATRRFTCPPGFKTGGKALPRLFSGLLCEVFDDKTGHLKDKPRMAYLKCLREILRLFKKLPLESGRDESLDFEAKSKFLQCDEATKTQKWDPRKMRHLAAVCRLVLSQLEGVNYEEVFCKHGPGAVREHHTANQKWNAVSQAVRHYDETLEGYAFDVMSIHDDVDTGTDDARRGLFPSAHLLGSTLSQKHEHQDVRCFSDTGPSRLDTSHSAAMLAGGFLAGLDPSKQSRLVTVAKNSTSRRTITVEPTLLQFVQQGLNIVLRDQITKCGVLRHSLDLTDQSHNQKLALDGSRTGMWATLDLSSASDLLSLELVKFVFQDKPTFLDRLVKSRSSWYTDGRNHRALSKYAGMGNATTFPVQSVCFALLAIAAILDEVGRKPTRKLDKQNRPIGSVDRASRLVRVYGDDIIVPAQYSHKVVEWLEHFGLRVNKRKSFTDYKSWWEHQPCFRESCGVDAYGGVDITPLYLRALIRKPSRVPNGRGVAFSTDPSAIASTVATSNLAWERCLYSLSATLAQSVEESLKRRLPLVPARSSALGWHSRKDACNPTKWDPSLQRLCFKAPVLKPTYKSDRLDGYAALLKFYHVPLLGRGPGHLQRSQERFSSKIVWRWMPAECR